MFRRQLLGAAAALSLLAALSPAAAQDETAAFRDLATASDFRVRVAAALALGKSNSSGARPALEKALGDPHPAVRVAAAAALGSLGDAAALPALRRVWATETTATVQAQLDASIRKLSGSAAGAAPAKPKYLVSLGRVENRSGVSRVELPGVLKTSARQKIGQVLGVEVLADGADASSAGKTRGLPAFTFDVALTQLTRSQGAEGVGYAARVECIIRRMPDQTLKGTMTGNARSLADASNVHGQDELSALQDDAIAGAVESAVRGASPALQAATK